MKRIVSILLILCIVLTLVIFPSLTIITTNRNKVLALSALDSLLLMYPAEFISWTVSQWASMGMQGQNLADQLQYMNRNGDIDSYFQNVYAKYLEKVHTQKLFVGTYFRTVGSFWENIYNGGDGITGVKELWTASSDPVSPYYIDLSNPTTNYHMYPMLKYEGQDPEVYLQTYGNKTYYWLDSYKNLIIDYGLQDATIGNKRYTVDGSNKRYAQWLESVNGAASLIVAQQDLGAYSDIIIKVGYVPILSWININGALDGNGNKYKLSLWRSYIYSDDNGATSMWGKDNILNIIEIVNSVNAADIETISVQTPFNSAVISQVLNPIDIPAETFVDYTIDDSFIAAIALLQEGIADGIATVADSSIAMPTTDDYAVVTDIPAIAAIVGTVAVAIPDVIPIKFPHIEIYKVPTLITTKFPFSIPWDLTRAITMMSVPAVTPVFIIPFVIERLGINETVEIDFAQFEIIAKITRWFILVLFMIGLILATRGLIKG